MQADAELHQLILLAGIRRAPAWDVQAAAVAGLTGLRDPEVLALAARDGRVLVTQDQKTMPRHCAACITTATSPGVLVIPQRLPVATAVDDVLRLWSTLAADEWSNTSRFLPRRSEEHPRRLQRTTDVF